jgi:hypothetical protein
VPDTANAVTSVSTTATATAPATENRSVGGSIPPLGTIPTYASASLSLWTYAATLLRS